MQELFEKMTQLTTMHNTLLEGVHKSTQGLKESQSILQYNTKYMESFFLRIILCSLLYL